MVRAALNLARAAARRGIATRAARLPALSARPGAGLLGRPVGGAGARLASATPIARKGLSPESEIPPAPKDPEEISQPVVAAVITDAEYHALADEYLETIVAKLEELQEGREDVDVEFAAGVLTVSFPETGTYVINKQPPNKQIWLSSPTSGPKRYDWVIMGDGQNQKEGTAAGDWIYLRDLSSMNDLFLAEIGVDLSMPISQYGK